MKVQPDTITTAVYIIEAVVAVFVIVFIFAVLKFRGYRREHYDDKNNRTWK